MNTNARPADIVGGMTAAAEAPPEPDPTATRLPDGRVRCACGAIVKPTRPGGLRPRPHLRVVDVRNEETGELEERRERCTIVHQTETRCKRCGGTSSRPIGSCRSPVFHPDEWDGPNGERFGNAAAAGAILGVSGEYFEYILRRYGEGAASRPPAPVGIDLKRRYMYWDLAAVEEFDGQRPGLTASADRLAQLREERTADQPNPDEPATDQGRGDRTD